MAFTLTPRTFTLSGTFASEAFPEARLLSVDRGTFCVAAAAFLEALGSGKREGTLSVVVDGGDSVRATGTVTLSGAGGVAASGTITFSSASGTTSQTINGVTGFSQTTGDDTARAAALAAAITASTDPLISGVLTASAALGVVTITAVHKGTTGNAITLAVTGTGVARSGATLSGGTNNSVTATINGVGVTASATDLTDTAAAAALAVAINASANALVNKFVTATSALGVVTLTAIPVGSAGNAVTLAASGTGATASGARLTGGVDATLNTQSF